VGCRLAGIPGSGHLFRSDQGRERQGCDQCYDE
jgi:hypothetical protein